MTMPSPRASLQRCAGSCSSALNGSPELPRVPRSLSTLKFGITDIVVIQLWTISVHGSLNSGCLLQPKLRVYKIEARAQRLHRDGDLVRSRAAHLSHITMRGVRVKSLTAQRASQCICNHHGTMP